ncbi:MAG: IclR family transcriptional regulator [Variovorax sp.]
MRVVKGLLDRSLELLGLLARDAGWHRLSSIAQRLQLQSGPAHRLLAELMRLGWVEQEASTDRYRLTLKLSLLGQQFLYATGLPGMVQPILDSLAARCGELVRLTVVQGDALYWFASSQGAPPGLMYQPSMTSHPQLHATANGKAWLATLPDETAVAIALEGGLADGGGTSKTIHTVQGLVRELALTRRRGYGLSVEEAEAGVRAIAIAIAPPGAPAVGTMSIGGPLLRMGKSRDAALHQMLMQAGEQLQVCWPTAPTLYASTLKAQRESAKSQETV